MTHLKDILVWMLMMFCYFDYNIVTLHHDDEINLVVVGAWDDAGPGCLQPQKARIRILDKVSSSSGSACACVGSVTQEWEHPAALTHHQMVTHQHPG